MIQINNYKQVTYSAFQKALDSQFEKSELKEIEIALKVGVKTTATVKNAFRKDMQIVSDEVLTKIMETIKLEGFVLWINGKRFYYIN
mgnify:CR=1 FL=1|jgi:hypothetical protein